MIAIFALGICARPKACVNGLMSDAMSSVHERSEVNCQGWRA
jgi:hypothetical protein